jgi:outer membrane receptor protein involved in Fe transport
LTGFNAEDASLLTFRPDRVTNHEVGAKGTLFDRLTYTAALFRIDWEDPQLAGTFLPSGFQAVVNAEDARTQGIELEGRLQATERLSITAGYTYTDAEFTRDFATPLGPSDVVPDFQGSDGNRLPGVPKSVATWAVDYLHPVGTSGDLHFRIDGYYRSDVVTASSSESPQFERLDGFDIWNASITWTNDHWRAGVFARNIGDEVGITAVLRDFSIASPTESLDMIMQPRTIGLIVGYDF